MTDATTQFFEELGQRGHEPLLENASGTIRFDIANGRKTDQWLLTIDKGDIAVAHRGGDADTVLRGAKPLFEDLAKGKTSPISAVLRGAVTVEGEWRTLVLLRRLFTGSSTAARETAARTERRRR